VVAGVLAAMLVAPAGLAGPSKIFPPDLGVEGQSITTAVQFALIVTPSYSKSKPGVTITMTNCKSGQKAPIRLVRRIGALHGGETLHAKPGKIVWDLKTIPGKPAKRKIRLNLAIPSGNLARFCTVTTMYDKLTKNSVSITTRVPL